MLGAVMFGHKNMQAAIHAIKELALEAGKTKWEWTPKATNQELVQKIARSEDALRSAYHISNKQQRNAKLDQIRAEAIAQLTTELSETPNVKEVEQIFFELERNLMRQQLLNQKTRIDGRGTKDIRKINIELGILPRTHGSANFTRGETQALVVTTLGT